MTEKPNATQRFPLDQTCDWPSQMPSQTPQIHPSPSGPGAPLSAAFTSVEFEAEALLLDGQADDLRQRHGGDTIPSLSASGRAAMMRYAASLRAALAAAEAEQQRLREALDEAQTRISAFVDQFDAVVPHMAGMALMSQIHGVPYAGPQMDIEPLRELLKGDQ